MVPQLWKRIVEFDENGLMRKRYASINDLRYKKQKESSSKKIVYGNNNIKNEDGRVIIPDECGDTMWDEVLQQEVNALCGKNISKMTNIMPNSIDAVQVE